MATDTTKAGIPGPTATASERALIDSAQGWMVVGATFLATFVVFGVAYSFGSFFESMADEFDTGKGATALMFSITTALYFFLGLITGRVTDRVGPRPVMAFGAVSLGVGLLATSRVNSIWAGYLTYGIGVGMAVACCYVPMVSTVGAWFVRRRTAAMGVSVAGIGFGTLVMAPAAASLIDRWGWRDTYVFLGVAGAALLLVGSLAARRPPRSATEESPDLGAVIRDRRFLVLYGASLLLTVTLFVPFVFIEQYATSHDIPSSRGAALVGIIGGASIAGRLALGALGARLGAVRLMQLSFGTTAASFLIWLLSGGAYPLLVVFAVVMGVGYGGFIALAPAVTAIMFGTRGLGTILGALYTGAGIGGLVGPPLAGAVIDATSYEAAILAAAVVGGVATAILGLLPRVDG